jgi:hypothetical protein
MHIVSNHPSGAKKFVFGSSRYNAANGEVSLSYQLDSGPELVEKLVFPYAPWPPEPSRQAAFEQALNILHLVAGVSYYKTAVPGKIEFHNRPPAPALAEFMTELYIQGLAEFGFVNDIDVASRVRFEAGPKAGPGAPSAARELLLPERALVAMGGGKDSLVGLDLLRRAGVDVTPICVGSSSLIGDTVAAARLPLLRIKRQLAPELKSLNDAGALNGHIPVTAINSAILLCAAILYGFRYVVFSNERSANEATLINSSGEAVNHQYSKTSAFEKSFRQVIHSMVSPEIEYFSILRPLSELDIVRRFCELSDFHQVYSSCNRNFHLQGSQIGGRWCMDCPKCRFAALCLAVFMTPAEVQTIQGVDLLNDADQDEGFRALCGLGRDKPFECVGEIGESRAALMALTQRAEWRNHVVVKSLAPLLQNAEVPAMSDLLQPSKAHFIPKGISNALSGEFGQQSPEDAG